MGHLPTREAFTADAGERVASTTIVQNVEQVAQMAELNHHPLAEIAGNVRTLEQLSREFDQAVGRFQV